MSLIKLSEQQIKILKSLSFKEPRYPCRDVSSHSISSLRVRGFIEIVEDGKTEFTKKYIKTERVLNVDCAECKN